VHPAAGLAKERPHDLHARRDGLVALDTVKST
jgi:hypothetical protein